MKRNLFSVVRMVFTLVMMFAIGTGCAANKSVVSKDVGILERVRHDLNPLVGGSKIESVNILGADAENPNLQRIVVGFDRPTQAKLLWSAGMGHLFCDGVVVRKMDQYGYVNLITLDMSVVMDRMEIFHAIKVIVGSDNPLSGYPNYHDLEIREKKNAVADAQGIPLEVAYLHWDDEKQRSEERVIDDVGFLKK